MTLYQKKDPKTGVLRSPYWYARYTLANGKLAYKSTGLTKKREAQRLANEWEIEQIKIRKGRGGAETQEEMQRFVADQNRRGWRAEDSIEMIVKLQEIKSGKKLKIPTLQRHLTEWLIDKESHVSDSTLRTYRDAIASIARVYGSIGNKRIAELQTADLRAIQDQLKSEAVEKGTTMRTVNYKVGVLKSAIKDAFNENLITSNIGLAVKNLPEIDSKIVVPFSIEEIEDLMRAAKGEWKGMILFGAQTGLRISNLGALKWKNIDIEKGTLTVEMVKQRVTIKKRLKKVLTFPLNDSMLNCLKFLGNKKKGFLFPEVASMHKDTRTKAFNKIMKDAGVGKTIDLPHQEEKGYRSFHSLRHSFNSFLANNDVSQDVRKKYTGHSTNSANDTYTSLDPETMKRDLEKLPEIKWQNAP